MPPRPGSIRSSTIRSKLSCSARRSPSIPSRDGLHREPLGFEAAFDEVDDPGLVLDQENHSPSIDA